MKGHPEITKDNWEWWYPGGGTVTPTDIPELMRSYDRSRTPFYIHVGERCLRICARQCGANIPSRDIVDTVLWKRRENWIYYEKKLPKDAYGDKWACCTQSAGSGRIVQVPSLAEYFLINWVSSPMSARWVDIPNTKGLAGGYRW